MEDDNGSLNLLNPFSVPIMLIIFALTAVGVTTCTIEKNRAAKWKRELSWQPSDDTYIYPLSAGELTPVINVRGQCYRVRADPHNNKITTYTRNQSGNYVPVSPSCNTDQCPQRRFKIEKSGYLFMDRVTQLSQPDTCKKFTGFMAGWTSNDLPRDSATQNKYKEALNRKLAEENKKAEAALRKIAEKRNREKKLRNSFEMIKSVSIGGGEFYSIPGNRKCLMDNFENGRILRFVNRSVSENGIWSYENTSRISKILEALSFDNTGGGCRTSYQRLIDSGFFKDEYNHTVLTPVRENVVFVSPRKQRRKLRREREQQEKSAGQWFDCKGTDYWRENRRCPWGQKILIPADGNPQLIHTNAATQKPKSQLQPKTQKPYGRWLDCKGTDYWRVSQACPLGQKVFVPAEGSPPVDHPQLQLQLPSGRWLRCKGTDYWRVSQACPQGQKVFIPEDGSPPIMPPPSPSYRPPPGWKLHDGNCATNFRYIQDLNVYICQL